MDYEKTLEVLEKTLEELREANKHIPIIVEGVKDIEALRKLGVSGEILRYNRGLSISNFSDMISRQYKTIILLTDWDKKGGYLCSMIKKNLESRVACNTRFREVFAKHSVTRKVEGLPSWLQTLQKKINPS